ncbi:hypothetical protein niasHS_007111 [Heterodera schachtii]|uniref:adenylate cyclase n=1 Tax=Heterodera schachtii TaxID=97005 RepID=A0ABD2JL48_HETSC
MPFHSLPVPFSALSRPFGDAQLEALFNHKQLHRAAAELLRLFSMLIPVQLVLALCRVPSPDPALVLLTVSAAFSLVLCVFLSPLSSARFHHASVSACALWLFLNFLLLLLIPSDASHSLIPSLITIFVLFAFFPFRPLVIFGTSFAISLAQLGAFGFSDEAKPSTEKLIAALLAHLWTHLVGFYSMANGRKISRAVFLSARNSVESETEWKRERERMAQLLSASLPPHVISSVLLQLDGPELPRVFVEHFAHASVIFARFHGLASVLAQLQVPDSARLLNELDLRIGRLAKLHGLLLVQSDAVLAISGVPEARADHALVACRFAFDLLALTKSFNESASVDIDVRVGIGSGSLSGGIVGARRWHWEVIGMAMDAAMHLEANCAPDTVLISDDTRRLIGARLAADRVDRGCWRLSPTGTTQPTNNPALRPLLFLTASRRFSLLTTPQAINRLLNQSVRPPTAVAATTDGIPLPTPFTKRKQFQPAQKVSLFRRRVRLPSDQCHSSLPSPLLGHSPLMPLSLRFADRQIEQLFHAQIDRWFIPGLALSVLFLALSGLFQALAMPRLLTTLATLALALALMFLLLLGLYVSCCESFCQFVTRTSVGRSVTVLLVLSLLSICGIANSFSCPSSLAVSSSPSASVCLPVHFPSLSFTLWMLHSAVFPRFPSVLLLPLLLSAVAVLSVHLFLSHPSLYTLSTPFVRLELLLALLTLALLLFLNSRRNELLLRMDFLAMLRAMEDDQRLQRTEFLNDQILHNALPAHIALNYASRTEPFVHLCPSVGVLCARLGQAGDWVGEFGFDRLNRIVCDMDQRLAQLSEHRLEKVRSAHSVYVVACGILPELARNVHDTPCTIGEQLAVLAEFAQEIEKMADSEGLDIAIGLDCGTALSVVVGWDGPRYELWGQPNTRAKKLMEAASALGGDCLLLSEEVYSALRPRAQFSFDEQSALSVAPGLVAYSLLRPHQSQPNSAEQLPQHLVPSALAPPPPPHRRSGGESDRNNNENIGGGTDRWRTNERSAEMRQPPLSSPQLHQPNFGTDLMTDLSPCSSSGALLLPPNWTGGDADGVVGTTAGGVDPLLRHIRANPLAEMAELFNSMHSSLSSELFSVDLISAETDSELEWVTPEMIAAGANGQDNRHLASSAAVTSDQPIAQNILSSADEMPKKNGGTHQQIAKFYKAERARQYSDFSEVESQDGKFYWKGAAVRKRRKIRAVPLRNGPLLPKDWRSSANTSTAGSRLSLEQEASALDKLNSAARRVDRMLRELAGMNDGQSAEAVSVSAAECVPFPLPNGGGGASDGQPPETAEINGEEQKEPKLGLRCREESGGILSEYDNNNNNYGTEMDVGGWTTEEEKQQGQRGRRRDSGDDGTTGLWHASWESRLEMVRRKLMVMNKRHGTSGTTGGGRRGTAGGREADQRQGAMTGGGGDEADISCSCSSMASSQQNGFSSTFGQHHILSASHHQNASQLPLLGDSALRWRQSAHSIGYDNEYEIASAPVSSCSSFTGMSVETGADEDDDGSGELLAIPSPSAIAAPLAGAQQKQSVGQFAKFMPIDSEDGGDDANEREGKSEEGQMANGGGQMAEGASLRSQMLKLSKDIRANFGDFPLANFSDEFDLEEPTNSSRRNI